MTQITHTTHIADTLFQDLSKKIRKVKNNNGEPRKNLLILMDQPTYKGLIEECLASKNVGVVELTLRQTIMGIPVHLVYTENFGSTVVFTKLEQETKIITKLH